MGKKDIGKRPEVCPYCGNEHAESGDMITCDFEVSVDYFCVDCERHYDAVYIFERVEKNSRN